MRKKNIVFAAVFCAAVSLMGCGSAIPDMTEEETHIISEYAANLLLKYDKNYEVKVVDTTAYHEELKRQEEAARKAEEAAAKEAAKQEEEAAEKNGGGSSGGAEIQTVSSIEEFYGLSGVQIQYGGFGVYESYPEQTEGEDLFFALGSTYGKKLLVLFFDVTNISGAETEVNLFDLNPKIKISVNGGAYQNPLFTMLPDELTAYKGMLGADETVRTVIVTEIPESESEAVSTIALTLKNEEGSAQLVLQ